MLALTLKVLAHQTALFYDKTWATMAHSKIKIWPVLIGSSSTGYCRWQLKGTCTNENYN